MDTESNSTHILAINHNDNSDYLIICNLVKLIIIILLLWYFVRSHIFSFKPSVILPISTPSSKPLPVPIITSPSSPPPLPRFNEISVHPPLTKGLIGGVPVYFYETSNDTSIPRDLSNPSLYVHNSKTFWKDVNTPNESLFWSSHSS